jgi:TolB-like protein
MIRKFTHYLPLPLGEGRGEGVSLRLIALALLTSTIAIAAPLEPKVAVVPYQGVGADPGVVEKLAAALRTEVAARKWDVVSQDETDRRERAAAMCGEDAECLSTVGQRLEARYVVAFGVARVGAGLMINALFIDAQDSKKLSEFSERLTEMPSDAAPLAARAIETLLQGRTPPVKLIPAVEEKKPQVVIVPATPQRANLRPVAMGVAIGAGGALVAGGVLSTIAAYKFSTLPTVPVDQRMSANDAQRGINAAADATMITAGVAAVVAVVLFIVDGSGQ